MYKFHFTLYTSNGEQIDQDRCDYSFAEFFADRINDAGMDPETFTKAVRTVIETGEKYTIDTPEEMAHALENTLDELVFRRRELNESIDWTEDAIKQLRKK